MFYTIPSKLLRHGMDPGLKVEYFNNKDLTGEAIATSVDSIVDVNWQDKAPRSGMDDDNFGVRWTGELQPAQSGIYQLGIITTCNTQLYLEDSVIAKTVYHFRNEYGDPRLRKSIPIKLEQGRRYKIRIDASETFADAQVQLVWAAPKPDLKQEAIDIAKQAEAIILCMGITPRMEGEEMDIKIDGFRGGDRTQLRLPQVQGDLIKSITSLGKPVVLVLLNGSALAINWEDQHVPAILEAWYPGQASGTAIADVLFGDYNPGGKLPVTYYKSENDLPPFEQYAMTNQTYRYFKGEALYPFGYGLSYTQFKFSALKLDSTINKNAAVNLRVQLTNTGSMDGDEVVQVYIKNPIEIKNQPIHSLKAFKRVNLKAGESRTVQLSLRPDAFTYFNDQGQKIYSTGIYKVFVGGGQPVLNGKPSDGILSQQVVVR